VSEGQAPGPAGQRGIIPTLAVWRQFTDDHGEDMSDLAPYVLFYIGWHAALANREAAERPAAYSGIRVTLGCGHMYLREAPADEGERREWADRWVIGSSDACHVCPDRKRRTGGRVSALRQVVNIEPVTAPREPESLDPVHWYWEGEGD